MIANCIFIIACCLGTLDAVNVSFRLTTPEDPNTRHVISKGNYSNLVLNPGRQYKFLCHGYLELENPNWYANLTAEYVKKKNVNLILVGYQEAVSSSIYSDAVKNVPKIAAKIAEFIEDLNKTKKISLDNIHLIGGSLGGQVVGITGEKVISLTGLPVARVTGIDPAAPLFYSPFLPYIRKNRLSKSDAKFVDVLHSSIVGVPIPIGDADFFPNGGINQSGCNNYVPCNHGAAGVYFYYSINKEKFVGHKCKDYKTFQKGGCNETETALMGDPTNSDSKGSFYLNIDPKYIEDLLNITEPPKNKHRNN